MKSYKYNVHWQIIRTEAKRIKEIDKKIQYVLQFLDTYQNWHNYDRIHNWLKMTSLSYHKKEQKNAFENALRYIEQRYNSGFYRQMTDNVNEFWVFDRVYIERVYKDLKKRKYWFQIKSVPKDHIDFMERIEKFLNVS